jgi:hypothetical protein
MPGGATRVHSEEALRRLEFARELAAAVQSFERRWRVLLQLLRRRRLGKDDLDICLAALGMS